MQIYLCVVLPSIRALSYKPGTRFIVFVVVVHHVCVRPVIKCNLYENQNFIIRILIDS